MELPIALRQAVDSLLEGTPLSELKRASELLSRRYRAETRDGRMHLSDDLAAKAYLAARLPATFAAVRTSMERAAESLPDFQPRSLLDVGAGPGTALWAASDCWPELETATLIEASAAIRAVGTQLAAVNRLKSIDWRDKNLVRDRLELPKADLVSIAYVLDELAEGERSRLIEQLWSATNEMLVIVEPGTPAGWQRIRTARSELISLGARLAAPCPHQKDCPLHEPDWCHFAQRVARSKIHRLTKDADVPWEDEKYIYLVATRSQPEAMMARVIAPVKIGGGKVQLKLCRDDGSMSEGLVTKREGDLFRWARRADWGDATAS